MKKKNLVWLACGAGILTALGYPYQPVTTSYTIVSPRINDILRIVILSDLHGSKYGKKMEQIIAMVRNEKPDLILIPGDLFDEFSDEQSGWDFLDQLREYPVYYVSGNHEEHREDTEELMEKIRKYGVHILNETSTVLRIKETSLELAGIPSRDEPEMHVSKQIAAQYTFPFYRILLSHHPDLISLYKQLAVDLIVSGHAHGGQWRLPGSEKGLIAPQQGLFPRYTNGVHTIGESKLVISRGLCRTYHYLPRLFNAPEIVSLTLMPENLEEVEEKEGAHYVEKITAGTESL